MSQRNGCQPGGMSASDLALLPGSATLHDHSPDLSYSGTMTAGQTGQSGQMRQGLLPVRRPADIDYRLARQTTVNAWRSGNLGTELVCDAQPMLRRNAVECGTPVMEACPICEEYRMAHVTYVFGPRLPSHGRCISTPGELARLDERRGDLSAYVVEVCAGCGWNHLVRITSMGRGLS